MEQAKNDDSYDTIIMPKQVKDHSTPHVKIIEGCKSRGGDLNGLLEALNNYLGDCNDDCEDDFFIVNEQDEEYNCYFSELEWDNSMDIDCFDNVNIFNDYDIF